MAPRATACVTTRPEGDAWVVEIVGDFDLARQGAVRRALNDLVVEGHTRIVVDLRRTGCVDSAGLGLLIAGHRKTRAFGGALTLLVVDGPVTRLLSLTGLSRVLHQTTTLEDAVSA